MNRTSHFPFRYLLVWSTWLIGFGILADAQVLEPDRLLAGSLNSLSTFKAIGDLPLPAFRNQKLCSTVNLAPNVAAWAYVPTALERTGNFSAFAGQLLDPLTNKPFPGNIIPASRLPGAFAWRLAPAPAALGEACVTLPAGVTWFSNANYITGRNSGDAIFSNTSLVPLAYTLGSTPPSAAVKIGSFSGASLSFAIAVTGVPLSAEFLFPGANAGVFSLQPIPNLSVQALPCCTTTSTLNFGIKPANFMPGTYESIVNVTPINTIARIVQIEVDLTVTAPASWVTTSSNTIKFDSYVLGDSNIPKDQTIQITSLGAASSFSIRAQSAVPPGVNWFTVTPSSGAAIGKLTISLNTSVLNKLGRGQFTGYFDIIAPGAPNSPFRIMVFATVFPNADFTPNPQDLSFTYDPNGAPQAPKTITLDPVLQPQGKTSGLAFTPIVAMADAGDPVWLRAAPSSGSTVGLTGTIVVSLVPGLLNALSAGDHLAYVNLNSPATATDADPANSNTALRVPVTLTVVAPAAASPITATQVLSQIADGGGWQTKFVLINTDLLNAAPISLRFWPGQDTPATLVPVLTTGSLNNFTLTDTIPKGGSKTYLTRGASGSPLWQGWGELTAPASVSGTAVFRHSTSSNQDNEGAVPLKPADGNRFVLPFDCSLTSAGQFVTSMALINAAPDATANVTVTAVDKAGVAIVLPGQDMAPRAHSAFAVCGGASDGRFPALSGKQGVLVFSTPAGQISGLGLRFSQRSAFTSIGTLTAASAGNIKQIAHIADGGGWETDIVIVNLDTLPASVTVRFNPSSLNPPNLPLALATPGLIGSVFTTPAQSPIPPNGSLWISTQASAAQIYEGWAEVRSNANVNGFAIFRNRFSATADSEGAVPFTSPGGTRILLPFDNTRSFVTSLAIVSPGTSQAQVTAVFRDPEGNPITAGCVPQLGLLGHTAFGIPDKFQCTGNMSGTADFTTTGTEMFGIGLLFNPLHSFTSVPLLRK